MIQAQVVNYGHGQGAGGLSGEAEGPTPIRQLRPFIALFRYDGNMSQTLPVVMDYDSLFSKVAEVVRSNARGVIRALLFGSLARREANQDSDVDLLLVWPADGDADYQWEASMETAYLVDRLTDRHCLPLVYTEVDYCRMPQRYPHLAESLSRDGIDLLIY